MGKYTDYWEKRLAEMTKEREASRKPSGNKYIPPSQRMADRERKAKMKDNLSLRDKYEADRREREEQRQKERMNTHLSNRDAYEERAREKETTRQRMESLKKNGYLDHLSNIGGARRPQHDPLDALRGVGKVTGDVLKDTAGDINEVIGAPYRFIQGMVDRKPHEDRTLPEKFGSAWRSGTYDVTESLGGVAKYLGNKTGANWLENAGQGIVDYSENAKEGFEPKKRKEFSAGSLADPNFYADTVFRQAPNMATSVLGGLGVMGALGRINKLTGAKRHIANALTGGLASNFIDSGMEAGGTYNQAEKLGVEPTGAFEEVLGKNLLLNSGLEAGQFALGLTPMGRIANRFGKAGEVGLKATGGAMIEGAQEGLQGKIQADALNQDFSWTDPSTIESMVVGALIGGGMTGAMAYNQDTDEITTSIENRVKAKMSDEQKNRFEKAQEVAKKNGYDDVQANDYAFEDFAKTPEGQQRFQEATKEYVDNKKVELEAKGIPQKSLQEQFTDTFTVGEEVEWNGDDYKISSIGNGSIELEDTTDGTRFTPNVYSVKKKNPNPIDYNYANPDEPEFNAEEDIIDPTQSFDVEDVQVGDTVYYKGKPVRVTDTSDRSMYEVENEYGTKMKVGKSKVEYGQEVAQPEVAEPPVDNYNTFEPKSKPILNSSMYESENEQVNEPPAYNYEEFEKEIDIYLDQLDKLNNEITNDMSEEERRNYIEDFWKNKQQEVAFDPERARNAHNISFGEVKPGSIIKTKDGKTIKVNDSKVHGSNPLNWTFTGTDENGKEKTIPFRTVNEVNEESFNAYDEKEISEEEKTYAEMKKKIASSGNTKAKTKLKRLKEMKEYAEKHGLEFSERYQNLLEKFEQEVKEEQSEEKKQEEKQEKNENIGKIVQFEDEGHTLTGRITDETSMYQVELINGSINREALREGNTNVFTKWVNKNEVNFVEGDIEVEESFTIDHLKALSDEEQDRLLSMSSKNRLRSWAKDLGIFTTEDSKLNQIADTIKATLNKEESQPEEVEPKEQETEEPKEEVQEENNFIKAESMLIPLDQIQVGDTVLYYDGYAQFPTLIENEEDIKNKFELKIKDKDNPLFMRLDDVDLPENIANVSDVKKQTIVANYIFKELNIKDQVDQYIENDKRNLAEKLIREHIYGFSGKKGDFSFFVTPEQGEIPAKLKLKVQADGKQIATSVLIGDLRRNYEANRSKVDQFIEEAKTAEKPPEFTITTQEDEEIKLYELRPNANANEEKFVKWLEENNINKLDVQVKQNSDVYDKWRMLHRSGSLYQVFGRSEKVRNLMDNFEQEYEGIESKEQPKEEKSNLSVKGHSVTMEKSKHTKTDEDIWIVRFDNEIDNWKEVSSFLRKSKGRYYNRKFSVKELRNSWVFKEEPNIFDQESQKAEEPIIEEVEEKNNKILEAIDDSVGFPKVEYKDRKTSIIAKFIPVPEMYTTEKTLIFPKGKEGGKYNNYLRLPNGASVSDINDWLNIEFAEEGVTAEELTATFDFMNNNQPTPDDRDGEYLYNGRKVQATYVNDSYVKWVDSNGVSGSDPIKYFEKKAEKVEDKPEPKKEEPKEEEKPKTEPATIKGLENWEEYKNKKGLGQIFENPVNLKANDLMDMIENWSDAHFTGFPEDLRKAYLQYAEKVYKKIDKLFQSGTIEESDLNKKAKDLLTQEHTDKPNADKQEGNRKKMEEFFGGGNSKEQIQKNWKKRMDDLAMTADELLDHFERDQGNITDEELEVLYEIANRKPKDKKENQTKAKEVYVDIDEIKKSVQSEFDTYFKEHIDYLKASGGKGVEQGGVIKNEEGEVIDRYGRISKNPKWYQDFYAEHKRKPNNAEYQSIALDHMESGFDDETGSLPAWTPNEKERLQNELPDLRKLSDAGDQKADDIIDDVNKGIKTIDKEVDRLIKEKRKEVEPKEEKKEEPKTKEFKNITDGINFFADRLVKAGRLKTYIEMNPNETLKNIEAVFDKDIQEDLADYLLDNTDNESFTKIYDKLFEPNNVRKILSVSMAKLRKGEDNDGSNEVRNDVSETPGGTPQQSVQTPESEGNSKPNGDTSTGTSEGTSSGTGQRSGNESVGSRGNRTATDDTTTERGTNYRITPEDDLNIGTAKETGYRNLEIIKLAKQIESEGRFATKEEQEKLVRFTGWGGLKEPLDQDFMVQRNEKKWVKELNKELKEVLTEKEFFDAQQSRLNAHYTSKEIIQSIYEGLEHFGFDGGRVLEPSMGVGHFVGVMTSQLSKKSKVTGVELDGITGLVGKLLYPQSDIRIQGFEKTTVADNFYDLAIGNVPFGDYRVNDPDYNKLGLTKQIHDYFFAKSIDKVRDGGIMAFITSKGTMDKQSSAIRQYLGNKAEFIGAVRLPSNAFGDSANTEVVTDLIILKKLPEGETSKNKDWLRTADFDIDGQTVKINKYFTDNPEMMLGTPSLDGSMYRGAEFNLKGEGDIAKQLAEALKKLPADVYEKKQRKELSQAEIMQQSIPAPTDIKEGAFAVKDGKLFVKQGDNLILSTLTGKKLERAKGMVEIRTALRKLFHAQIENKSKSVVDGFRKELNVKYDKFVKTHGYINQKANTTIFSDDPDFYLLTAIEKWDSDKKKAEKADIFFQDTVARYVPVSTASTPKDALSISLLESGQVDIKRIAELLDTTEAKAIKELGDMIFKDPTTESYVSREEYLSGDVRRKLDTAQNATTLDKAYKRNVDALEQVIPETVPYENIDVALGAGWVGEEYVSQFIKNHLMGGNYQARGININYNPVSSVWTIEDAKGKVKGINENNVFASQWGSTYKRNDQILDGALNGKSLKVYNTIEDDDGNKKKVFNKKATFDVRQKVDRIRDEFKKWLFEDEERAKDIERIYNEKFNSYVVREYDASFMPDALPNMNPAIELRAHQKNAIYRMTQSKSTLLAHAVGAGKTFEMIGGMMELKRLGQVKKPMWVVPNHLVDQMARDFQFLYPSATVFVPTKKDFEAKNRKKLFAKIATGNYDVIIMAHSSFGKVSMNNENIESFFMEQIRQLDLAIEAEAEAGKRSASRVRSSLEKLRKSLREKMEKKLDQGKKDTDTATFEEMGVDAIVVDEAHEFKNLMYGTKRNNIGGLGDKEGSDKAFDMFMKVIYTQKMNGKVVFATGTPISNSIAEMYHMLRYLATDRLKEMSMNNFDAWADVFAEIADVLELAPEGKGFKVNTKVSDMVNAPELLTLFHSIADVKTTDTLLNTVDEKSGKTLISHPKHVRKTIEVDASDHLSDFIETLVQRAEAVRKKEVDPDEDNMLVITNDGRKSALDMRIIDPSLPDDPNSKVNYAKTEIYDIWKKTKKEKGTQLVFIDTNTPDANGKKKKDETGEEIFSVYHDLKDKLVRMGIPEKEISFIHEANTDARKLQLFDDVNTGKVRVLLGSSQKMGAGMNVQKRLKALHHLDVTWRPSDLEQREGRILRQGNIYQDSDGVELYTYVQKGSFDAYMWQLIEYKAKMINKIISGEVKGRRIEDEDDVKLNPSMMKALATDDPRIFEFETLKMEIDKLEGEKDSHADGIRKAKRKLTIEIPHDLKIYQSELDKLKVDANKVTDTKGDKFKISVGGMNFDNRKDAGKKLFAEMDKLKDEQSWTEIGEFSGFKIMYRTITKPRLQDGKLSKVEELALSGQGLHAISIGTESGTITAMENALTRIKLRLEATETTVNDLKEEEKVLTKRVEETFGKEDELEEKRRRRDELALELDIEKEDKSSETIIDDGSDDDISSLADPESDGGTDRIITPKVAKKAGDKIAKSLDTVLRSGYVPKRKARGTFNFNTGTGNIKGKEVHNMRVIAHELGHAFEYFVGETEFNKLKDELYNVAETLYPGGEKLQGKSKRREGLAELFQLYVIDPEVAKQLAPKTFDKIEEFVKGSKELNKTFNEVRTMIENDAEGSAFTKAQGSILFPDEDRFTKHIGDEYSLDSIPEGLSKIQQIKHRAKSISKKVITEALDFKVPFRDFQKELEKKGYVGKNILKMLSNGGDAQLKARRNFEGWAVDKYGRYIIQYDSKEELPTFLEEKYNEMDRIDPNSADGNEYMKRYKSFYKEYKKKMGNNEAKEKAILHALSSRSLQEISVDAITMIQDTLKGKKIESEGIKEALSQLDDQTKKESSFKLLSAIMQSYRYAERYARENKDGEQKFDTNPIEEELALKVIEESRKLYPGLESLVEEYTNNLSEILLSKAERGGLITTKSKENVKKGSSYYIPTYYASKKSNLTQEESERKTAGQTVKSYTGKQEVVLDFMTATMYKMMETETAVEFKGVLDELEWGLSQKGMGKFGTKVSAQTVAKEVGGEQIEKQIINIFETTMNIDASNIEGSLSDSVFKIFMKRDMLNSKEPLLMNWHGEKKVYMRIAPELYNSLASMKPLELNGFMRFMAKVSSFNRYLAITTPKYVANTASRDTLTAYIQRQNGKRFLRSTVKGMIMATGQDERVTDQYINSGSFASATENILRNFKRKSVTDDLLPTKDPTLWKLKSNKFVKLLNPSTYLGYQEQIHRYGQWYNVAQQRALEEGIDFNAVIDGRIKVPDDQLPKLEKILVDAGYEASNITVDFRGHGRSEGIRKVVQPITFLHGTLQGMYREHREMLGNPKRASWRMIQSVGAITLLSWAIMSLEDEEEEIPTHMRDKYWFFPTPFGYYAMAKPFSYAIATNYVERFLDDKLGAEGARKWYEDLSAPLKQAYGVPFMPMWFSTMYEIHNNKAWYGGEIISVFDQKNADYTKFDEKTSDLAIKQAEFWYNFRNQGKLPQDKDYKAGIAPKNFDYFVRGMFGSYGSGFLELVGGKESKDPLLVGGLFYTEEEFGSRSISKFYKELDQINNAHKNYGEKGKPNQMVKDMREMGDVMRSMNGMMKDLAKNKELTAKQKAEMTKKINNARKDVSRFGIGQKPKDTENLKEVLRWAGAYEENKK